MSTASIHALRALSVLLLAPVCAACSSDNTTADGAVTDDGSGTIDLAVDGNYAIVDQPLPPLILTCTPAETTFNQDPCAKASIVLDRSKDPTACALTAGESRSADPVLTFERQDDVCAGDTVLEVLYYASVNAAWRFESASHGSLDEDRRRLREIPAGQLVATELVTTDSPPVAFALSFRIDARLSVTHLEQQR